MEKVLDKWKVESVRPGFCPFDENEVYTLREISLMAKSMNCNIIDEEACKECITFAIIRKYEYHFDYIQIPIYYAYRLNEKGEKISDTLKEGN